MTLVICETVAAIVLHVRRVTPTSPIRLGGHSTKPLALCGSRVDWDTECPVSLINVTCRDCRAALAEAQKS